MGLGIAVREKHEKRLGFPEFYKKDKTKIIYYLKQ
jgi:hypothetical protein